MLDNSWLEQEVRRLRKEEYLRHKYPFLKKEDEKRMRILSVLCLFCIFSVAMLSFTGCTYSITMVHTEGTATDVVDETATNTPSTSITPTVSIPAAAL